MLHFIQITYLIFPTAALLLLLLLPLLGRGLRETRRRWRSDGDRGRAATMEIWIEGRRGERRRRNRWNDDNDRDG